MVVFIDGTLNHRPSAPEVGAGVAVVVVVPPVVVPPVVVVVFCTLIATLAVVERPSASNAVAFSVCAPFGSVVVFTLPLYGEVVSVRSVVLSTAKTTFVTALSSAAIAA